DRLSLFLSLSKSGIVTLVLISVLGGFLCGHPLEQAFSGWRLLTTLLGVLFLASGSSALNQYQEREIDARMPRTAKRPLPTQRLTPQQALAFAIGTLILGAGILLLLDRAVFALGLLAVFSYNVLYTGWWKKHWAYAAIP